LITFQIWTEGNPRYAEVCEFARTVYMDRLEARLTSFPEVFAVAQHEGEVVGCFGLSSGDRKNPLFLETHLDFNILEFLSGGELDDRKYIGELGTRAVAIEHIKGSLESLGTLISVGLSATITLHAHELGFQYLVFTATRSIRLIARRLDSELTLLGEPDFSGRDQAFLENWKNFIKVPQQCYGVSVKQAVPGCQRRLRILEERSGFQFALSALEML